MKKVLMMLIMIFFIGTSMVYAGDRIGISPSGIRFNVLDVCECIEFPDGIKACVVAELVNPTHGHIAQFVDVSMGEENLDGKADLIELFILKNGEYYNIGRERNISRFFKDVDNLFSKEGLDYRDYLMECKKM